MRFSNRSLTQRGSKRRVQAIRARDYWSWKMSLFVIAVLSAVILILYLIVTNPPQH